MDVIQATIENDIQQLSTLLMNGADPNLTEDIARVTPLHYAASQGLYEAALLLLTAGAKLTEEAISDKTPTELARMNNQFHLVSLFNCFFPNPSKIAH